MKETNMDACIIGYTQIVPAVRQQWETAGVEKPSDPLHVVENCASVCYDSVPDKENHRITRNCIASGHLSVLEHISFTFHISGVSRSLLAQLTRHRHASFSVRSQRYCNEVGFEVVVPDACEGNADFNSAIDEMRYSYGKMTGDGIRPEDARAVLPNACCTELCMTMNARALIEASHLRLCNRAQKEIRELFQRLKEEVECVCPEIAELMVPQCEKHKGYPFCTELKSCGKRPKIGEVYGNKII